MQVHRSPRATITLLVSLALVCGASACKRDNPATGSAASATPAAAAPAGAAAHCDTIQLASTCREYRAIAVQAAGEESLRQLCGIGPGTYAAGPCGTADLVGTCDLPEHIERYYAHGGSPYTAQTAQAACASGLTAGTFRAGP